MSLSVEDRADDRKIEELGVILLEEDLSALERLLAQAFDEAEALLVLQTKQQLKQNLVVSANEAVAAGSEGEWISIESLSRLRQIVGGRFDNIKRKWIAAGFPLKEHKGSQINKYSVNQEGWAELSNWMVTQGFESRILTDADDGLFEVRELLERR